MSTNGRNPQLNVHIDRLVLRGIDPLDKLALANALKAELANVLGAPGFRTSLDQSGVHPERYRRCVSAACPSSRAMWAHACLAPALRAPSGRGSSLEPPGACKEGRSGAVKDDGANRDRRFARGRAR